MDYLHCLGFSWAELLKLLVFRVSGSHDAFGSLVTGKQEETFATMKLYFSKTSPYTRKVLLVARQLGQIDDIEIVPVNPLEAGKEFLTANPLSKVPALVVEDEPALFDSRVIVEFLLDRAGMNDAGRAKTEMLKRQALADGITDAALAIVMEKRRPPEQQSAYWMERWFAAIDRGLAHLEEGAIKALEHWHFDAMATASALDYLCFRLPEIDWSTKYPETSSWYAKACERDDMKATDPRD